MTIRGIASTALDFLATIAPDDPIWDLDSIEVFVSHVQSLATQKRHERETLGNATIAPDDPIWDLDSIEVLVSHVQSLATQMRHERETLGNETDHCTDDPRVDLIRHLQTAGLLAVDKRPKGGRLWVEGDERLRPMLEALAGYGINFHFAPSGARATGGRPGWWTAWSHD